MTGEKSGAGRKPERDSALLSCDAACTVTSIKALAEHFRWVASQVDLKGPVHRPQLRRDIEALTGAQDGIEALADRALRELNDLDEAIRRETQEPCP